MEHSAHRRPRERDERDNERCTWGLILVRCESVVVQRTRYDALKLEALGPGALVPILNTARFHHFEPD